MRLGKRGIRFESLKSLARFKAQIEIFSPNYLLALQSNVVFDLLKAHLKRAPSLRGAALVRLASLKFQAEPWPPLVINKTEALARLDEVRFKTFTASRD